MLASSSCKRSYCCASLTSLRGKDLFLVWTAYSRPAQQNAPFSDSRPRKKDRKNRGRPRVLPAGVGDWRFTERLSMTDVCRSFVLVALPILKDQIRYRYTTTHTQCGLQINFLLTYLLTYYSCLTNCYSYTSQ